MGCEEEETTSLQYFMQLSWCCGAMADWTLQDMRGPCKHMSACSSTKSCAARLVVACNVNNMQAELVNALQHSDSHSM